MTDKQLEGSIPLTDAIIDELVERKMARKEALVEAKAFGARYHPQRNSLIFPFDATDDDVEDPDPAEATDA